MSSFLTALDLRVMSEGRWMTIVPFQYESDLLGRVIIVPAEFITDLASVPRVPFAYMITGNRARGPAVIHDWFYQHPDWDNRGLADGIFNEASLVDQPELGFDAENSVVAALMWSGVRVGGWYAFNNKDRARNLNPIWTTEEDWPQVV